MEHGPCSTAGGVQGTQEGLPAGTAPKKAFSARSAATTGCQVLSTFRGVSLRILRAVETSQREDEKRIARLDKEGRIRGSGCSQ